MASKSTEQAIARGQSMLDIRAAGKGPASNNGAAQVIYLTKLDEIRPAAEDSHGIAFDLPMPPGLAGEVAEYIFRSSRMPIRSFAVAGALQALSYLNANNRWVKRSDTALNLYQCLIGDTGKGKEDPRKAIKRLVGGFLFAGGICESISSGPALLRSLESERDLLILTDEFGLFLQVAMSDRGSVHLKELVKELLTLYGLGRDFFAGKRYADSKFNIGRIDNPYVNLLGTTTPLELLDGVTSKSVNNGFLNRILFVEASGVAEINREPNIDIPESISVALKEISSASQGGIDYEDGAHHLMANLGDSMGEKGTFANMWPRAEEQMIRVAGILAIGDGGTIRKEHVTWAHSYVVWCIRSFTMRLGDELAETPFEKRIVKAMKAIENARSYVSDRKFAQFCSLGYMPRSKLMKLLKVTPRELDEVISYLSESGSVTVSEYKGNVILSPERIGQGILENQP